jgi:uncharacterized protein YraI
MNVWKQIPGTTRVYLVVLVYLLVMFLILIFTRLTLATPDGFSLLHLLARNGDNATATAVANSSLTATARNVSTFPSGTPWLRATGVVRIYDGPGSEYDSIAVLELDQSAEILGASPDHRWWAIRIPYLENGQGWVPADQVTAQNADNVSVLMLGDVTPTVQNLSNGVPTVLAADNVNIRSGPDMIFSKVGMLRSGQAAEVVGISEDGLWWAIKLPGEETTPGWVAKDYVTPSFTEDVPIVKLGGVALEMIPPTPAPEAPSLTANYAVNIRAGPGVEYAVVAQLGQGQIAEVVGVSSDGLWIAINLPSQKNGRGWVAGAYVRLTNASDVPILK